MTLVKFNVNRARADHGAPYEAGQTYDLDTATANRWVDRGCAQLVNAQQWRNVADKTVNETAKTIGTPTTEP